MIMFLALFRITKLDVVDWYSTIAQTTARETIFNALKIVDEKHYHTSRQPSMKKFTVFVNGLHRRRYSKQNSL